MEYEEESGMASVVVSDVLCMTIPSKPLARELDRRSARLCVPVNYYKSFM